VAQLPDDPLGSEETRTLSRRLTDANYDRMERECHRLNQDVMILTNENRELRAERDELKDELSLTQTRMMRYRRG